MPNPYFSDLPTIFVDTLGVTVTYQPAVGDPFDIQAIPRRPFVGVDAGVGVDVESSVPSVDARAEDIPAAPHGDTVVVLDADPQWVGITWEIVGVEPDGQGMVRLLLNRT